MKPSGKWIRRALIPALALLLALAPGRRARRRLRPQASPDFSSPSTCATADPPAGYVPGGTALTRRGNARRVGARPLRRQRRLHAASTR